jgi:hypothetical protein
LRDRKVGEKKQRTVLRVVKEFSVAFIISTAEVVTFSFSANRAARSPRQQSGSFVFTAPADARSLCRRALFSHYTLLIFHKPGRLFAFAALAG